MESVDTAAPSIHTGNRSIIFHGNIVNIVVNIIELVILSRVDLVPMNPDMFKTSGKIM